MIDHQHFDPDTWVTVTRACRWVAVAVYGLSLWMVLVGIVWAVLMLVVSSGGVILANMIETRHGR